MVGAAGSLPGDMHKLWRSRHPKQFHLEYGYSCMGYEIAGGLGVKMADPEREVYVMLGDGSYLMMAQEIITSVQEKQKLTIVLMNNNGYRSIGALSRSLGQEGFGTRYAFPGEEGLPTDDGGYDGVEVLPVDLVANARSLGAYVIECQTLRRRGRGAARGQGHRAHDGHLRRERPLPGRARLRVLVGCAHRRGQRIRFGQCSA